MTRGVIGTDRDNEQERIHREAKDGLFRGATRSQELAADEEIATNTSGRVLDVAGLYVPCQRSEGPRLDDTLVRGEFFYTVQLGDTLTSIRARFGVAAGVLARVNGLQPSTRLKIGQELRVYNRHIVPPGLEDGILINLPQRL